ncbi:BTB/POZ and MATH domain-containing protein 4-like [Lolium rigidum]|uniref:BTB/POZ and MATH domain-containing protein 4-like n=1 Tax=Lolium rigidum TaxID=89674 RepID=UPI001F5D2385|nr:BTB/POZ and MATH domain-containing protein 4-like [Lolium rigidum]
MAEYSNIPVAIVAKEKYFVMKIYGYSRTKEVLKHGEHATSARFSVGGHHWIVIYVLDYYPNGEKDADFVSVYLRLDSSDAKVVKAKFKFSMLDKDGEPVASYNYTSPITTFRSKGSDWGYNKFIKKADLDGLVHLRDDCLSIRCDVSVIKASEEIRVNQLVVVPPSDLHQHLRFSAMKQIMRRY